MSYRGARDGGAACMTRHALRVLRAELLRERRRIHAEAISHGPCARLAYELSQLELRERALACEERRRRATRGGLRGVLVALRLAAPVPVAAHAAPASHGAGDPAAPGATADR